MKSDCTKNLKIISHKWCILIRGKSQREAVWFFLDSVLKVIRAVHTHLGIPCCAILLLPISCTTALDHCRQARCKCKKKKCSSASSIEPKTMVLVCCKVDASAVHKAGRGYTRKLAYARAANHGAARRTLSPLILCSSSVSFFF